MPRTLQRQAALRFCCVAVGWLACLFAWTCALSFSIADPPSTTVWPPPDRVHNLAGLLGAWLAFHAFTWLGVAVYPVLALLNVMLFAWSRGVPLSDAWLRFIGLLLVAAATAAGAALLLDPGGQYLVTGPGGLVGTATAAFFVERCDTFATGMLLAAGLIVGLLLAADSLVVGLLRGLTWAGTHSAPVLARGGSAVASAGAAVAGSVAQSVAGLSGRLTGSNGGGRSAEPAARPAPGINRDRPRPEEEAEAARAPARSAAPAAEPADDAEPDEDAAATDAEGNEPEEVDAPLFQKGPIIREIAAPRPTPPRPRSKPAPVPRTAPADDPYELPPIALLERGIAMDKAAIEASCRDKAYILEQTLKEFRLDVEVVAIETGPVITVFELKLAPGIKVSQISSLNNDMARALKAPAVRVVAPLPGKNTIGIEVPNVDKEKVRLRDVLEQAGPRLEAMALPLFLGKDASGQPLVTDLTRMPHLLIAGTTGSGKSVCVTSIIMSLLLTRSPSEVNMILIDPKVVEMAAYKDLPHLMCPIVTEVAKAESILDWASLKMDERYALLAEAGVKDIRGYNRLGLAGLRERLQPASDDELAKIPVHLPYIVIIIDELADLMMTSAKEVEFYLCRIAQKSRAVGIHLIVSTQRPQANVVTGLIKSNLPCRIAFRVASRLDSRIVLDQNGGEVLMGQGDMLFLPPGSSKLVRAQGTFVDDEELRRVVRHCREQRAPQYHPELVRAPGSDAAGGSERDELFDQAVEIVLETGRGSVSLLQRRLTIGYGRASRLIDQMYEAGIVGEYKGSQAREVNLTKDEWDALRRQRDREEAEEKEPQG